MAVSVAWDNDEQTILRYDVKGHWTWDEFTVAFKQGLAMVAAVTHRVDFMVNPLDQKSRGYLPPNTIYHVITMYRNSPPNKGLTVVIGGGSFFKTLNELNRRLYPRISARYLVVDSLEEARAALKTKCEEVESPSVDRFS
jgi:hypothetical protein